MLNCSNMLGILISGKIDLKAKNLENSFKFSKVSKQTNITHKVELTNLSN